MSTTTIMTSAVKKTLRVLHVGVSNRGAWPLEKCNADTGFAPAYLCDVSEEALAKARGLTGLPASACGTDYAKALRDAEADCVIICAPTVLHVKLATMAVEAGLPVLVEKGMAPDWRSAQQLAATVKKHNAIACVAQNYRYNPVERTLAEAICNPEYPAHPGRIHMITYTQNRVRPVPRTLTYPFASVWDMSCHHFDNLLAWMGPMRDMTAFGWGADWSAYEHDNNTSAHITFENGAHGHYLHTHDAARANVEIQIHGERGALVHDGDTTTFNERPVEQFGTRPLTPVSLADAHGEADLLRDFHAYITRGREPGVSVRHNLETMAACEMMVRSVTAGRTCTRKELDA